MSTQTTEHAELPIDPSADTLRQQLDIQWRDHIQTREQTWKALQMVAVLFVGYVGSGLKVDKPWIIRAGGAVCILAASFGIAVTMHHRKVQSIKFKYIYRLEENLGLHCENLLGDISPPGPFKWAFVFNFREICKPTFIMLLMHIAILVLAAAYMWERG
jgi:hypothetical protein